MIKLKPAYYNALLSSLANKSDPRYYLHGFRISNNDIISGNGVVITKVNVNTDLINDVIVVPINPKLASKNLKYVIIDVEGLEARYINKNDEVNHVEKFSTVDSIYPNIDGMIKESSYSLYDKYKINIKSINKVLSSMWINDAEIISLNEIAVKINIDDDNILIISTKIKVK